MIKDNKAEMAWADQIPNSVEKEFFNTLISIKCEFDKLKEKNNQLRQALKLALDDVPGWGVKAVEALGQ